MAIAYSAELKPGGKFPLIDASVIRGGFQTVQSLIERDSIPDNFRKEGMLCYVVDEQQYYRYELGVWRLVKFNGSGIPILTKSMIEDLGTEDSDNYISIPDPEDLNGEITHNAFTTSVNGNYVDVLFKSLRSLQLEVNRLKNSFKYGIQSYNGTKTAISSESPNKVEDEPLWAIEENLLSNIPEASININHDCLLLPKNNLDFSIPDKIKINGNAYWQDTNNVLGSITDSKIIIYAITSSLSLELTLSELLSINFNKFNLPKVDKYHTTFILSRNYKGGKNYIWVSIKDGENILLEGYLNNKNDVQSSIFELNSAYTIKKYNFSNLDLFKFNTYTKYEDFSLEVIPSVPEEDSYKYKVAHITIRAVDDYNQLINIINLLPDNELVWTNLEQQLYIKTVKGAVAIGSAQKPIEDGMTKEQVIEELKRMGIVYTDNNELKLSNVSDVVFVNLDTKKKFKFEVDAYGKLRGTEVPKITLADKVSTTNFTDYDIRGFVGQIGRQDYQKDTNTLLRRDVPFETHADRVKIGAFYPPLKGASVFGCSHAYIELENTSGKDFPLDGCYLHYAYGDAPLNQDKGENEIGGIYHLALKGTLKAGSTYLIRGKLYASFSDKNVKIKVKEFDLEWYVNGELIDLTRHVRNGLALTYGQPNLDLSTPLWKSGKSSPGESTDTSKTYLSLLSYLDDKPGVISDYFPNIAKCPNVYQPYFIDSLYYLGIIGPGNPWANGKGNVMPELLNKDCIFKNTFELDPAMQAFLSLNKFDSSRVRWQSANDYLCVYLDNDYIEFPKTPNTKMRVDQYTPRASYENKNVSTDKTKMDMFKPNVVFCSMGIDIYKTRTFNWISAGLYDEYLWLRKKGEIEWKRFESYKKGELVSPDSIYPKRKEYSEEIKDIVYNRFVGRFPGDNTYFTSHKCVIEVVEQNVLEPTVYEYVVGKAKGSSYDPEQSSEIMTFTLYPDTYTPRIYQHSDEQGFDWIQYQVWGAAAQNLNDKINKDLESEHIIPILVDTGDVVLNGTRINEWLDYYEGGKCLFNHLEAMDVVGNNDLCDTDPSILGTGDDDGKSNSFYFHIFHCLDINEDPLVKPIINNTLIPSLYYIDSKDYRILFINSELTYINCRDWFHLVDEQGLVTNIYTGYKLKANLEDEAPNIYDNKRFRTKALMRGSDLDVPIYTQLYYLTDPDYEQGTTKKIVCACHEMPFTVITNSSLQLVDMSKTLEKIENRMTGLGDYTRSINELNLLIGSHLNLIDPRDTGKGIYWFSRLLEFRGIKLCIGGHKHTYACSYPIRENYSYSVNGISKNSYTDGPMLMDITLENDNASWKIKQKELDWVPRKGDDGKEVEHQTTPFDLDTTKLPLIDFGKDEDIQTVRIVDTETIPVGYYGLLLLPCKHTLNLLGGVTYFMCLSTGYKYASNKELPSAYQAFSKLKPKTSQDTKAKFKDKASNDLKRPMYSIINLGNSNITIKLVRVEHIFDASQKYIFTQTVYDKDNMTASYLNKSEDEYGTWSTDESVLLTINY